MSLIIVSVGMFTMASFGAYPARPYGPGGFDDPRALPRGHPPFVGVKPVDPNWRGPAASENRFARSTIRQAGNLGERLVIAGSIASSSSHSNNVAPAIGTVPRIDAAAAAVAGNHAGNQAGNHAAAAAVVAGNHAGNGASLPASTGHHGKTAKTVTTEIETTLVTTDREKIHDTGSGAGGSQGHGGILETAGSTSRPVISGQLSSPAQVPLPTPASVVPAGGSQGAHSGSGHGSGAPAAVAVAEAKADPGSSGAGSEAVSSSSSAVTTTSESDGSKTVTSSAASAASSSSNGSTSTAAAASSTTTSQDGGSSSESTSHSSSAAAAVASSSGADK